MNVVNQITTPKQKARGEEVQNSVYSINAQLQLWFVIFTIRAKQMHWQVDEYKRLKESQLTLATLACNITRHKAVYAWKH